jgi:chloride channel protein, CIC family
MPMLKQISNFISAARTRRYLLVYTAVLGVIGALSAQLFLLLVRIFDNLFMETLAGYKAPGIPSEGGTLTQVIGSHGLWLLPVATTLGGLISGFLVYTFAPEAEGHGTDAAIKAYHRAGGFIRPRVPPLKMLTSAITIGSGGSAGREGPAAQFSAGIGSLFASLTRRTPAERRLLMLVGMASGLSAIFRSPIGTAFMASEVLYGGMEFEAGALLYTLLGSVIAYTVNGLFVGFGPLFQVPADAAVTSLTGYLWYIPLGLVSGVVATLIPVVFYGVRDVFKAIHIPPHFKPAIGGLLVGLIGLVLPQAIGGGYGWMQEAINGQLTSGLLLALVFVKILTLSLTISSGGSGGVFGPSLFVGVMLGSLLGGVFHQPVAAFAVVGMAAVFGGTARVPIATMLMVTEMTGGYHLLPAAALAVLLSYLVQSALSRPFKYRSLYEAQVFSRADSPVHYDEVINAALEILNQRKLVRSADHAHLDLEALILSGIPVDLGADRQLMLRVVKAGGKLDGAPFRSGLDVLGMEGGELCAIIRSRSLILQGPIARVQAGDRVLAIVPQNPRDEFRLAYLESTQEIKVSAD